MKKQKNSASPASTKSPKSQTPPVSSSHAFIPGSFDPPTLGHINLVEQALRLFGQVTVGIGQNQSKSALLETEERLKMLKHIFKSSESVNIITYSGLTVDAARQVGASVIVRGLRNSQDFNYEQAIDWANRKLAPEIPTSYIITPQNYSHISSTLVREIARSGGPVDAFVPALVQKKIAEKLS